MRDVVRYGVLLREAGFAEVSDNCNDTFGCKHRHDFLKLGTSEIGITVQQILERELSLVIASEDGQGCN